MIILIKLNFFDIIIENLKDKYPSLYKNKQNKNI